MIPIPIQPDKISVTEEHFRLVRLKNLSFLYSCDRSREDCSIGGKGCCDKCNDVFGYLKYIKKSDASIYEEAFDETTGFLGKNGCRLPLELRSVTCLTYLCDFIRNTFDENVLSGLDVLKQIMKDYEVAASKTKVRN